MKTIEETIEFLEGEIEQNRHFELYWRDRLATANANDKKEIELIINAFAYKCLELQKVLQYITR